MPSKKICLYQQINLIYKSSNQIEGSIMSFRKSPESDLERSYATTFQACLIFSMLLVLGIAKVDYAKEEQPIPDIIDCGPVWDYENYIPPPKPKPYFLIEVPNDAPDSGILDIDGLDMEIGEAISYLPSPPFEAN